MKEEKKTKQQLLHEVAALRQRLAVMEASGARHLQTGAVLNEAQFRTLVEQALAGIYIRTQDGKLDQREHLRRKLRFHPHKGGPAGPTD